MRASTMRRGAAALVAGVFILACGHAAMAAKRAGVTIGFECYCSDGSGSCAVNSDDSGASCTKDGHSSCTGKCLMKTTTTGASGSAAKAGAAKPKGGVVAH